MRGHSLLKHLSIAGAAVTLLLAFNNCGEGFISADVSSHGGTSFFSRAPGESCETALMRVYEGTYHPFLSQTCNNCHIAGPGIGTFADPNVLRSFNSFMSIGATKISNQALNDAHKPPYTGLHNTDIIESIRASWGPAQSQYVSCVAENGGGPIGSVVKTTNKPIPATATATNYARMEWDLETESSVKLPLIAGIDVRIAVVGGVTRGYEFRNPTLRLKSLASGSFNARTLNIYMNDEFLNDVTTYSTLNSIVSDITDTNLAPGISSALAVFPVNAGTPVSLEYSALVSTTATAPTPTPTPGTTPIPQKVTYAELIAAGGIFANSCVGCHNATKASGGLNITSYDAAKLAAANIKARVMNPANPMPQGGLLPALQQAAIASWVDAGAPQN